MKFTHKNILLAMQIIMACVCGILFLVLVIQLDNAPAISEYDSSNAPHSDNSLTQPEKITVSPEIIHYEEIIKRPLFHYDRKPRVFTGLAKEDEATIKTKNKPNVPKSKQQFSLTAIVISPEISMAILESENAKTAQRIILGESVEGWTLTEVQDQFVVIADGEETQTLELEVKGSNKTQKSSSIPKTSEEKK